MLEQLKEAEKQIAANREEIIDKLVSFSITDTLLFWGANKNLAEKQKKQWLPVLNWAGEALSVCYKTTNTLDVPEQEENTNKRMRAFLEMLSNKQLSALFAAALLTRSVLLASALVKGKISAEEAFRASFVEELWQAERWGTDEDTEKKRQEIYQELTEIEHFLKN